LADHRYVYCDSKGNTWISNKYGVIKYDGNDLTNYIPNGLINNHIIGMAIDHKGNKWFATRMGISKFDGNRRFIQNNKNVFGNREH
jgi:ligand-binding sensor domain-containing protein